MKLNKKEKRKNKSNIDGKKICKECFVFIQRRSWVFTVFIFFVVFVFAIYVWNKYIFSDNPSQEIIVEFQSRESQIDQKVEKIERVIEKIQKRKENFNNLPDYSNVKGIFRPKDDLKIIQKEFEEVLDSVQ